MKYLLAILLLSTALTARAEFQRIDEGGLEINLEDVLPHRQPAILLLYAPWDQESSQLIEELENWSNDHTDFVVIAANVVDERTLLSRQFELKKIPAIFVYDDEKNQVGTSVETIDELEDLLKKHDLP